MKTMFKKVRFTYRMTVGSRRWDVVAAWKMASEVYA